MATVSQGNTPELGVLAIDQHCACDIASDPSALDVERMLRADRIRFTYFSNVATTLAAGWRELARGAVTVVPPLSPAPHLSAASLVQPVPANAPGARVLSLRLAWLTLHLAELSQLQSYYAIFGEFDP